MHTCIRFEPRPCLRDPIADIQRAANLLTAATDAHLAEDRDRCLALLGESNLASVRKWCESLWGKDSRYLPADKKMGLPATLPKAARIGSEVPSTKLKQTLIKRDGYHCRFCGIPVIRSEVRRRVCKVYPSAQLWGQLNSRQNAAFQTMWLQYDHIVPHSRGGATSLENMVITCAPCNFGRMQYTLEEVGLLDPRQRLPVKSNWDGLERFR